MALPSDVTSITWSLPEVVRTHFSSSLVFNLIAIMPLFLTEENASISTFLITPLAVVMNRKPFDSLGIGTTAVMTSVGETCRKLTIARPLDCLDASGTS